MVEATDARNHDAELPNDETHQKQDAELIAAVLRSHGYDPVISNHDGETIRAHDYELDPHRIAVTNISHKLFKGNNEWEIQFGHIGQVKAEDTRDAMLTLLEIID